MTESFYRAFEDKHRGSRESIKLRLRVYLPFIQPLIGMDGEKKAVDLGCGRGEWLELLRESGFAASGVDLDEKAGCFCRSIGLNVHVGDAVSFLQKIPDASQVLVSGFHLAEHLEFSDIQSLVKEALRVLMPAGLLILETPNTENILVGTTGFYVDPTHQRPLPIQLLTFLLEYCGFGRVKVLRLQESVTLQGRAGATLLDVLGGVSPDYAVVAQKRAAPEMMALFETVFGNEHGLDLETLVRRFEERIARGEQAGIFLERFQQSLLCRAMWWVSNQIERIRKVLM
jgi:O-antigen chain-terminating methyltransferase